MAIGNQKNYPPGPGGATKHFQAADMNKIAQIRASARKGKSNIGSASTSDKQPRGVKGAGRNGAGY